MEKYEIEFRRSVEKELSKIPKQDQIRILKKTLALASNPRPPYSQKLSGQERYRIRQGIYRIVYEIYDDRLVIVIVRIAHRKDVYK